MFVEPECGRDIRSAFFVRCQQNNSVVLLAEYRMAVVCRTTLSRMSQQKVLIGMRLRSTDTVDYSTLLRSFCPRHGAPLPFVARILFDNHENSIYQHHSSCMFHKFTIPLGQRCDRIGRHRHTQNYKSGLGCVCCAGGSSGSAEKH